MRCEKRNIEAIYAENVFPVAHVFAVYFSSLSHTTVIVIYDH